MFLVQNKRKNIFSYNQKHLIIKIVAFAFLGGIVSYHLMNIENIIGNNLGTFYYTRGMKEVYYHSKDDAIAHIVPKEKVIIYEIEDGNVFIVFGLENGAVSGYEFLKKKMGFYEYIGVKTITFVTKLERETYSWEQTFKTDLRLSLNYKDMTKWGEDYNVLPSWGISEFSDVGNVIIEGIPVNDVRKFEYDGKDYYLWFINDVSSIESASEAEIVVK